MEPDYQHLLPDFFTLPQLIKDLPMIRARHRSLLVDRKNGCMSIGAARALLLDAQDENEKLVPWLSQKAHRRPLMSRPLLPHKTNCSVASYPSRIDSYRHSTDVAVVNGWRFARCFALIVIADTASTIASCIPSSAESVTLWGVRDKAEGLIRQLVDDFCASIPYILNPEDTETMLRYYPHAPGDAPFSHIPEVNLVASTSQLLPTIIVGSQIYCIPHSQKQWLQQYLAMLSRNPEVDKEKAMNLKLVEECRYRLYQ